MGGGGGGGTVVDIQCTYIFYQIMNGDGETVNVNVNFQYSLTD